ncbi:MAG: hypothetical protein LBQ08_01920 [Holosporaceae bacterium]|jgi:hypothetical protein|nr:hypothetical protein [Holosporaceae bacterium]
MINFSKIFVLLVFIFCRNSFAMQTVVVSPFFSEIKAIKTSEIPGYIDQCFVDQSKIIPSEQASRKGEVEVGDIIQPKSPYIIDFAQAVRNSARHMIESGHLGWFAEESHASAKTWPSFFYTKAPFASKDEAEIFARELIEKVVREVPLSFYGEVYSGDRSLVGIDFIGDIPTSVCSGVVFSKGQGKTAPIREGFKPKNIVELQKQNKSLIDALSSKTSVDPVLSQADPVAANKVILRVSFRKDPMYRNKAASKFLKYRGHIIDFLSLYLDFRPIVDSTTAVLPHTSEQKHIASAVEHIIVNPTQQAIALFEAGNIDDTISTIFENIGTDQMRPKEAFRGMFKVADNEPDKTNFMGLLAALRDRAEYVERKLEFLGGLIATLRTKL